MTKNGMIPSRRKRVNMAKEEIKKPPFNVKKISRLDREAFVETITLICVRDMLDITRKYQRNLIPTTTTGAELKAINIENFDALIALFDSAIDACKNALLAGHYSTVWKVIPEHALIIAASNPVENMQSIRDVVSNIYITINKNTLEAIKQNDMAGVDAEKAHKMYEEMKAINKEYMKNYRTLLGLDSDDADNSVDIPSVMDSVKSAVDDVVNQKAKTNPNNNQNLF